MQSRWDINHYRYNRQNHGASKLYRDMSIVHDDEETPPELKAWAQQIMHILSTEHDPNTARTEVDHVLNQMKEFVTRHKLYLTFFNQGGYRSWDDWLWDMRDQG